MGIRGELAQKYFDNVKKIRVKFLKETNELLDKVESGVNYNTDNFYDDMEDLSDWYVHEMDKLEGTWL